MTTTQTEITTARRPRLPLILGGTGFALFLALAAAMYVGGDAPFTQGIDDAWHSAVGASSLDEVDGPLPMFFQHFGELGGAVVLMLIVPITLVATRRWRTALFWIAAVFGSAMVASQAVKHTVDRERPAADEAAGLYGPLFHTDHGSFPSGHAVTMGAFIVAVAALLPAAYRRWWWPVAGLLAAGMMWQRTLINAHYITDTFAGILAGASFVALLWWALAPALDKDRGRPVRRPKA